MKGIELLEAVREEWPDTVRLLVTAYSDLRAAEDAINRGHVRRYLRKPWEPELMRAEISDAAALHQLNQEVHRLHHQLLTNEKWAGASGFAIADEIRSCLNFVYDSVAETSAYARVISSMLSEDRPSLDKTKVLVTQLESGIEGIGEDIKRVIALADFPTLAPPAAPLLSGHADLVDVVDVVLASMDDAFRSTVENRMQPRLAPCVKGSSEDLQFITLSSLTAAVKSVRNGNGNGNGNGGTGRVQVSIDSDEVNVYLRMCSDDSAHSVIRIGGAFYQTQSCVESRQACGAWLGRRPRFAGR